MSRPDGKCVHAGDVHAGDANIKGIQAHQGQVSVLEGYDGHVWSAGGTSSSSCFKEWSLDGGLIRESDTSEIGELCLPMTAAPSRLCLQATPR